MVKPAPFLREQPKAARSPKTYRRYRAVFGPLKEGDGTTVRTELHRSAKDAMDEIMDGMLERGVLWIEEVAVVAKRETRYEEVKADG